MLKKKITTYGFEIRHKIKETFNIIISLTSVYNLLKKLNFTYKKIYLKKRPLSEQKFNILKDIFIKKMKGVNKKKLISIDESCFYLNSFPNRGRLVYE